MYLTEVVRSWINCTLVYYIWVYLKTCNYTTVIKLGITYAGRPLRNMLYMMTSSKITFSALLALCAGNSPVTGEFPAQRSTTRSFDIFFDLRLNKRLNKQSWGWSFETPSRSLWRHCNLGWELLKLHSLVSSLGIFNLAKVLFRLFKSHSHLTGVTAAKLRWHLWNMNLISNRQPVVWLSELLHG